MSGRRPYTPAQLRELEARRELSRLLAAHYAQVEADAAAARATTLRQVAEALEALEAHGPDRTPPHGGG